MQKRKNNEARPKFTGFYKKKSVYLKLSMCLSFIVSIRLFLSRLLKDIKIQQTRSGERTSGRVNGVDRFRNKRPVHASIHASI